MNVDLTPYIPTSVSPWNARRAIHLFRRIQFGADRMTIQSSLLENPVTVIEETLDSAITLPLSEPPEWANKIQSEYALAVLESVLEKNEWARQWILDLQQNGLRGRMTLFWHNHFVTRFEVYQSSSYLFAYHQLLQQYALGNFKDFVYHIGLTPAMLVFLNGVQNLNSSPNENFARELFELFTLGVDNGYTQNDIVETARALTGYTSIDQLWGPIQFDPSTFDDGEKTIFGQTGKWGYDDVIDILFEQRSEQIATFICSKFYRHFVNPEVNLEFVEALANELIAGDWEIAPVIRQLFQSEHFFDDSNISTQIVGHLEHHLTCFNELGVEINGLTVLGMFSDLTENGQDLFNPVDVAGWPGNRSWLNTSSLTYRWNYWESQLGFISLFNFMKIGEMARQIVTEEEDVNLICHQIIDYFLPNGLQFDTDYLDALVSFKGEIPENYFHDGTWTIHYWALPFQVGALLRFINRMPEFQLR